MGGHRRRLWTDADGRALIERYDLAGLGHGTPVDRDGPGGTDSSGAFMLSAGISSTRRIAHFWGLAPDAEAPAEVGAEAVSPASGIGKVIADALRAAGLVR